MPTLYFKPGANNFWETAGNWFTNANGTGPAVAAPWIVDNLYKSYDLAFATGVTTSPRTGGRNCEFFGFDLNTGNSFAITGTCYIPFYMGYYDGDNIQGLYIYAGTYAAPVIMFGGSVEGGTFQAAFNTGSEGAVSYGIFNGTVTSEGAPIVGGIFNGAFIHNEGTITGGTFNGTYTRTGGNVTGGTFNNGIINQFYRNGFPPPLVFGGYNSKALDVLGTGLV
jgi:hypothetical protein